SGSASASATSPAASGAFGPTRVKFCLPPRRRVWDTFSIEGDHMRALALSLALGLAPVTALAIGPTANFTLPPLDTTPPTFAALPWPNDLYFDQGQPGDGDGTLLNTGASIGLDPVVYDENAASVSDGLDVVDGFGTTSAIFFFFSGPIDTASLPASHT